MQRSFILALLTVCATALVFAEAPKGWMVRADRSTDASDPDHAGAISFVTMGDGFHATNPQAAVYWNPSNTTNGSYTIKGTFVLQKPSGHTNYYGLVFGGSSLENASQNYLYFLVAQDGTFLVKRRVDNTNTENVVAKTASDAVKKPDASGKSTNALEVRVGADKVDYVVNGVVVHSMPKAGLMTDGIYGIRVNHQLEVHISGFGKA